MQPPPPPVQSQTDAPRPIGEQQQTSPLHELNFCRALFCAHLLLLLPPPRRTISDAVRLRLLPPTNAPLISVGRVRNNAPAQLSEPAISVNHSLRRAVRLGRRPHRCTARAISEPADAQMILNADRPTRCCEWTRQPKLSPLGAAHSSCQSERLTYRSRGPLCSARRSHRRRLIGRLDLRSHYANGPNLSLIYIALRRPTGRPLAGRMSPL